VTARVHQLGIGWPLLLGPSHIVRGKVRATGENPRKDPPAEKARLHWFWTRGTSWLYCGRTPIFSNVHRIADTGAYCKFQKVRSTSNHYIVRSPGHLLAFEYFNTD
jgi:hypothetical protein